MVAVLENNAPALVARFQLWSFLGYFTRFYLYNPLTFIGGMLSWAYCWLAVFASRDRQLMFIKHGMAIKLASWKTGDRPLPPQLIKEKLMGVLRDAAKAS